VTANTRRRGQRSKPSPNINPPSIELEAADRIEKLQARLDKLIDWYLRGGLRMEIDPYGHIRVTTREHIINWLDGDTNE